VTVRSIDGAPTVNTASGDVELGRVGGELVAKAASGDVRVDDAGAGVKIRTAPATSASAASPWAASSSVDVRRHQRRHPPGVERLGRRRAR
jgi:hypothetical protein